LCRPQVASGFVKPDFRGGKRHSLEASAKKRHHIEKYAFGEYHLDLEHWSTKLMYYNALEGRVIRDRVDLVAIFEEWQRVRNLSQDELGGNMSYELRGGRE
jgi:hypothetical protein